MLKVESNKINIDHEKCTNCEACVRECPIRLYYNNNDKISLRDHVDETYMECGHCVVVCPTNAITLKQISFEEVKEITEDMKKPSYEELLNSFRIRRSVRQFKNNPIPQELWDKLIEVARIAPTGHNDQLVHFTIVKDRELLSKFNEEGTKNLKMLLKLLEDPIKHDQVMSFMPKDLSLLIKSILPNLNNILEYHEQGEGFLSFGGELLIIHAPSDGICPIQDCTLAASNVMLAAELLGLGTCSIGIVVSLLNNYRPMSKLIKLPKSHVVGYVLTIGFPKVKYKGIPARQPAKVTYV